MTGKDSNPKPPLDSGPSTEVTSERTASSSPVPQSAWIGALDGQVLADRYRVLKKIGEGGFGEVYEAEQITPVRRHVALKVVKAGMDSKVVLARFDAERQALAIMDHPGIARVLDAGVTDRGLPFFVMELVRGTPITEHCDRERYTVEQRLRLFVEVCKAVQHAHTRAVLHRDIKPSNILVETDEAGESRPKVIDFGIAKALSQPLTEHTLFTRQGQVIGTPEYMSPEQADGTDDRVDVRSDVYALGVLLYELLTGHRPFDLKRAAMLEVQRIIREVDPPRPSTRLSGTDTATEVAQKRRTDVRELEGTLRRELEWIPLKALRKSRAERYRTAAELADDVNRYLEGKALEAGPESTWYVLRKAARRHRGRVIAASAVLLAATIGLSTAAWFAVQSAQARASEAGAVALAEELMQARRALSLVRDAQRSWPIHPDSALAMQEWLDDARAISARLPEFRSALNDALAAANVDAGDAADTPRTTALRVAEDELLIRIEKARIEAATEEDLVASNNDVGNEALVILRRVIAEHEIELDAIRASIPMTQRYTLEDPALSVRVDALCDTIEAVHRLTDGGLIDRVAGTLATARTLRETTITSEREAWDRAIASIADPNESPAYRGLTIEPQIGIVPLWQNRTTGLWEFWVVGTGERPERDQAGRLVVRPETGITLVLIPGGETTVGAQASDPHAPRFDPHVKRDSAEEWVRTVRLDPYFIAAHEMTQGQYRRLTGERPAEFGLGSWGKGIPLPVDSTHPVESVSWNDATAAVALVNLTLPTIAQWEHAARGGTQTPYWAGESFESLVGSSGNGPSDDTRRAEVNVLDLHSNEKRSSAPLPNRFMEPVDDGHAIHAPVDRFGPNPFGLYNVLGNVAEWTSDFHESRTNPSARRSFRLEDGDGRAITDLQKSMAYRGGSFNDTRDRVRITAVGHLSPDGRSVSIGIRPSRPVTGSRRTN